MRKILVATSIMIAITLIAGTTLARTGTVNTDDLNLRESASTSADVITVLNRNTKVDIVGEQDDWYRVSYDGKEGYLKKQYVDAEAVSQPETSTPATNETENNSNANENNSNSNENNTTSNESKLVQDAVIYALPILNATQMGNLQANTTVEVISKVGKWYYVMTDTSAGWILASKLSVPNNDTNNDNNVNNDETNNDNNANNDEDEPNNSNYPKNMYVSTDAVNVREEATTESNIITSIEKNTEVKVTGESGDWYSVTVSGDEGYIMKPYLSNNKS